MDESADQPRPDTRAAETAVVCDTNAYEFYSMAPPGVQLLLTSLGIHDDRPRDYDSAGR